MELLPASLPEQRPRSFGGEDFPLVLSPSRQSSARELSAWAASRSGQLQDLLLQHGAVLFRDCGITSAEDFGLVVRAMGCEGYDYVGGAAPRTEVVKGVVFTSNESPPDQPIPFHHELAQSPTPPNYILFCCEVESKHGGATPIIPSDEVADFFMSHFPDFAREVEAKGVRYIRTMPEVTDPTSAQGRSWAESYAVKTREEAEEVMTKQGSTWEWLSGGDLKVTTAALPALRMDERTGRRVFFNSVIAAFTGWNDSRNVGEEAVVLGDFSPVNKHALRAVARFMAEREVAFAWKKGDILIVDNGSVLHSRQSFEPPRRVLAALRGKPLRGPALRAGIIGTGAMGKEHIRNVALMGEQMVVTAIADSSEAALREALEELGGERAPRVAVFQSDEELINCDFVDVLIICTPNFQHIHTLRKAIMSGKHILCEKPLCTTVEDCEEVERLLTERVVRSGSEKAPVFMTGMEYRYMPPIRRLIEESDSRKLGEPRVLSIREHRFPFLVKVDNWNRFNRNTGGTLVEKACHFFDLMRRILQSEPVSVYASGDQAMNHKDEAQKLVQLLQTAHDGCQLFDADEAVQLLQIHGNHTSRCSRYPHGRNMDCGDGVALCGVLALEMGTGDGYYKHPRAAVHGLWPQVPPYGTSKCMRPTVSSADPNGLVSCYKPQSASESARNQVQFETHEWEKHGTCAGAQDASHYFTQICKLSARPLEIMDGIRATGGTAVDAADQLQRLGVCVWSVASHDQVYLSACAGSDGVWKLADVDSFEKVCGAGSGSSGSSSPSGWSHVAPSHNAWGHGQSHSDHSAWGHGPPSSPSTSADCSANKRGPACKGDIDCWSYSGCMKCARSGFCTHEKTDNTPTPTQQKSGMCVPGKHGPKCKHNSDCDGDAAGEIIFHTRSQKVVEFANGARASLDLCMFAEDEQTEQVRVVCQQGSVEAKCPESTVRIVQRRKVRGLGRTPPGKEERAVPEVIRLPISRELAAAGYHEGATFFELEAFAEAVRGKRAVPVTARDGKMAVLMGVAAHRSIASGRPVRLSPAGQIVEEPSADPPPPLIKQQVWSRL
ncbi:unnamed protein product [Symbiodinium sp. CCMP2592]|nr:unnamed protein product [Symbiodinium sp. CCMP2592]